MQVHLTKKSRNVKTGPIPVSTTSADTCPDACPFKKNGCYADGGPLGMFWKKVTEAKAGENWRAFLDQVKALPAGQLWRHNQAGDLPGDGDDIDWQKVSQLIKANTGKRGFTYTHKPMNSAARRRNMRRANASDFTINLSANNPKHADQLADMDCGPVVTVLPIGYGKNGVTPAGRKIVVCPATQRDDITCASCGLCQRKERPIIGFPAHGASKRKASNIAAA